MMLTAHVAVGAAVASVTGNPALGFAAGFASHFICDMVPHFDAGSYMLPGKETYGTREYIWAIGDLVVAMGLVALLVIRYPVAWPVPVAGGIGGALPDIVFNTPFWSKWTRNIPGLSWLHKRIHVATHWTVLPQDWLAGTVTQLVAIGGALWLLGF